MVWWLGLIIVIVIIIVFACLIAIFFPWLEYFTEWMGDKLDTLTEISEQKVDAMRRHKEFKKR